jgi:hypothetical protein
MAWKSGEKLEQAKRTAIEMEGISLEVMKQMEHQTNQMKHINLKVNDLNDNIDDSDKLINLMTRRSYRTKFMIYTGIGLLVLTLFVILMIKLAL